MIWRILQLLVVVFLLIPSQIILLVVGLPRRLNRDAMSLCYWLVVRRRRAAGEPEWQECDIEINRYPPPDHPYWTKNRPVLIPVEVSEEDAS